MAVAARRRRQVGQRRIGRGHRRLPVVAAIQRVVTPHPPHRLVVRLPQFVTQRDQPRLGNQRLGLEHGPRQAVVPAGVGGPSPIPNRSDVQAGRCQSRPGLVSRLRTAQVDPVVAYSLSRPGARPIAQRQVRHAVQVYIGPGQAEGGQISGARCGPRIVYGHLQIAILIEVDLAGVGRRRILAIAIGHGQVQVAIAVHVGPGHRPAGLQVRRLPDRRGRQVTAQVQEHLVGPALVGHGQV